MFDFKIEIEIEGQGFEEEISKEVGYFRIGDREYKDKVRYKDSIICISGERTRDDYDVEILETTNSTFYNCLVKSLLYIYFEKGAFSIESIRIKFFNKVKKDYEKAEIIQVFNPNLELDEDRELKINCNSLFVQKKFSDIAMNALMNLTMAFYNKKLKFDYTWKCFNCLIREIYAENSDRDMLDKLASDLNKSGEYELILNFAKDIDYEYLENCRIFAMICNHLKRNTKKIKKYKDDKKIKGSLTRYFPFEDKRVNKILFAIMKDKKRELLKIFNCNEMYDELYKEIENKIKEEKTQDADIVKLVILEYAYYLRCEYFHAEKLPTNFVVSNLNDKELLRISEPLILICRDLLDSKLF